MKILQPAWNFIRRHSCETLFALVLYLAITSNIFISAQKYLCLSLFFADSTLLLFIWVKLTSDAVVGSPVEFRVIDVNKVVVRGDGLGLVPTNRPASFVITAPEAQLSDLDVAITSEFKQYMSMCCVCSLLVLDKTKQNSKKGKKKLRF